MTIDAGGRVLLHVGFHKTGSSWLQQSLFCHENFGFTSDVGRPRHQIAQDFVEPDVFKFDAREVRARYEESIRRAAERQLTLAISHERLSGYPASGGYDRKQIADRLKETFPEARALIVVREQKELIRSMYGQYITDGGCLTIREFLEWPEPRLGRMPYFRFSMYEFDELVGYYQSLFGPDRVLVLPAEMLVGQPAAFLGAVAGFCGLPSPTVTRTGRINEKRPLLMQAVQRVGNRLFARTELNAHALTHIRGFPKRTRRTEGFFRSIVPDVLEARMLSRMRTVIAEYVGDRYSESNARLRSLTGLDLAAWGYSCAPRPQLSERDEREPACA